MTASEPKNSTKKTSTAPAGEHLWNEQSAISIFEPEAKPVDWIRLGEELRDLNKSVLSPTLFQLIEERWLAGARLDEMAKAIRSLQEEVQAMAEENTQLRRKLAWAVRSEDNSQQP